MYNTAIIVVLFIAILESLIIVAGNIFTIFVFWKHHNRLKRTSFLLINLAVADLFVGFTEPIVLVPFDIVGHLEETSFNSAQNKNVSTAFQVTFSFSSVLFLTLVSLERAYALIWPLRHRVSSTKGYIYSATFAWVAAISSGILTLLAVYDLLDFSYWIIAVGCVVVLCLVTISASYLTIRTRLNSKVPIMNNSHNRRANESQRNVRLSRTLFVVMTASLLFWIPGVIVNATHFLCINCVPLIVFHIFNLFRLANSLVNPIIYSFRIPMFRETFKRMKLCKQSMEYTISYKPWDLKTAMKQLPSSQVSLVYLCALGYGTVANHQSRRSQMQKRLVTTQLLCIAYLLGNEIIPCLREIAKIWNFLF